MTLLTKKLPANLRLALFKDQASSSWSSSTHRLSGSIFFLLAILLLASILHDFHVSHYIKICIFIWLLGIAIEHKIRALSIEHCESLNERNKLKNLIDTWHSRAVIGVQLGTEDGSSFAAQAMKRKWKHQVKLAILEGKEPPSEPEKASL